VSNTFSWVEHDQVCGHVGGHFLSGCCSGRMKKEKGEGKRKKMEERSEKEFKKKKKQ